MKIVRLFSENVKRIKVAEVRPQGDGLVVVGGDNDQGKSSLIDSIEYALGGKGTHPSEPLRRGAKHGRVVLDLGDIEVTRTFGQGGATALLVESKAGKRFPSPQAMLDKLYGALSFDPLAFERQDVREQSETLRRLVGLDFSDLDKLRERLYTERTDENRALAALKVSVAALERYPDAPESEVSVQALNAELAAAEALARAAADADAVASKAEAQRFGAKTAEKAAEEDVARLERQLAAARERLGEARVASDAALTRAQEASEAASQARAAVPDTGPLHAKLEEAEGLNEKVRANAREAEQRRMLEDQTRRCEDLTHQIEAIDEEKSRRLSEAKYPVPGLGMDANGAVLLHGIPFEQASASDRIRVSVAMGLALHPKLKVLLVRDGSLIGERKLQLIEEMVKDANAQLWIEMVQAEPTDRTTVFLEDGVVTKGRKNVAEKTT
jgi:DNA repair exonuclease SbcCD ATPase subunit